VDVTYPGFGKIEIEGETFDRDMVVDRGMLRPRKKGPSKRRRSEFGHTPLTVAEDLPWSGPQLIIGTGFDGRLPVADEVIDEAAQRGVELVVLPTSEACALLQTLDTTRVSAVLHVTC
jgi:hypothetical protein